MFSKKRKCDSHSEVTECCGLFSVLCLNYNFQPHCADLIMKGHWRREWQTTSVFLPWEPHEQDEKAKDRTLKDELPRSVGAQYATGDQWRNNSRKNEEMEPKWEQQPPVDVTGVGSKSNAIKNNIAKEPGMLGPWIKVN